MTARIRIYQWQRVQRVGLPEQLIIPCPWCAGELVRSQYDDPPQAQEVKPDGDLRPELACLSCQEVAQAPVRLFVTLHDWKA